MFFRGRGGGFERSRLDFLRSFLSVSSLSGLSVQDPSASGYSASSDRLFGGRWQSLSVLWRYTQMRVMTCDDRSSACGHVVQTNHHNYWHLERSTHYPYPHGIAARYALLVWQKNLQKCPRKECYRLRDCHTRHEHVIPHHDIAPPNPDRSGYLCFFPSFYCIDLGLRTCRGSFVRHMSQHTIGSVT